MDYEKNMKIKGMTIQWVAIILILFFDFFQISIAAGCYNVDNQSIGEPSFRYLVDDEIDPDLNKYTRIIIDEKDFNLRLNQFSTVIAYFYCKSPHQKALERLQKVVNSRNGLVYVFKIALNSETESIFQKYNVETDAEGGDTILIFQGGQLISEDSYFRGVTDASKLKRIVYWSLNSCFIRSETEFEILTSNTKIKTLIMIFDDGQHNNSVRKIRDKLFDKKGADIFIGIITPSVVSGDVDAFCLKHGIWDFPSVDRYENGKATGIVECKGSESGSWSNLICGCS